MRRLPLRLPDLTFHAATSRPRGAAAAAPAILNSHARSLHVLISGAWPSSRRRLLDTRQQQQQCATFATSFTARVSQNNNSSATSSTTPGAPLTAAPAAPGAGVEEAVEGAA